MSASCTDVLRVLHRVQYFVQSSILVCMYDLLMLHFLCSLDKPIRPQHNSPFAACFVTSALPLSLKCSFIWQHIPSSSTVHCAKKPSMLSFCWTSICRHITARRYITTAQQYMEISWTCEDFLTHSICKVHKVNVY